MKVVQHALLVAILLGCAHEHAAGTGPQPGTSEPDEAPAEGCGELFGHGCEWVYLPPALDDPDPQPARYECAWQGHPDDPQGRTFTPPSCDSEACCGPRPEPAAD